MMQQALDQARRVLGGLPGGMPPGAEKLFEDVARGAMGSGGPLETLTRLRDQLNDASRQLDTAIARIRKG